MAERVPDVWDADFPAMYTAWKNQVQLEIGQTVERTMETIAQSRALMAKVDRLLELEQNQAAAAEPIYDSHMLLRAG